jgi:hypothetical protein
VRLIFYCLLGLLFCLPLQAEELLAKAQRELRARKFYFGEIHGKATRETSAAVRKFQEARGIDNSGNLDDETLRALGLPFETGNSDSARALGQCCTFVQRYYQAWERGDWKDEGAFYADKVYYYEDREVDRDDLREIRRKENLNWPQRKAILLQRIATPLKSRGKVPLMQVTARVRTEVTLPSKEIKVRTEDVIYWLEKKGNEEWRIFAVKVLL